jgi:hypothetical protein
MKVIKTAAFRKVSQMFHAKVGDFALIARGGETPNDEIQFTSPSQAAVEQEKQKAESQVQGPGVQEEDEFFQTMQPVTYEVRQLGPEDANLIKQYNAVIDADNFDANRQAEDHYGDGFNSVPMSSDIDNADYHIKREKEEGGSMASSYFNLTKTAQYSGDENHGDDITSGPINQDYQDYMREYSEGKHRIHCPKCGMEPKTVLNPSNPEIVECQCGHRWNPLNEPHGSPGRRT